MKNSDIHHIKTAFTLIELIFVIVIIGILAGVASSTYKDNYLQNDTQFILAKIRQAQYRGIGYEHSNFGAGGALGNDTHGCIELTKSSLQESASDGNLVYSLHVDINTAVSTLCFDAKGRPHDNTFDGTLLTVPKVINLSYSGQTQTVSILPVSGYAIINCN